jgi:hypothetical protein
MATELENETLALQQLEKISKAIRALEGLPVQYSLARKLAEVSREIAEICAPHTEIAPVMRNSCNRHANCEMAVQVWLEKHPGMTRLDIPFSFHCHDDECEDCFGC